MRALWFASLITLACGVARAADAPSPIYDHDPAHLWNRLYAAIAVRTEDGVSYGIDNSEPFREPFDDPAKVASLLAGC